MPLRRIRIRQTEPPPSVGSCADVRGRDRLCGMNRLGRALLPLAVVIGAVTGLGAYTFHYGEGLSYFSTDPKACVNCHIMSDQYVSWQKAGHHQSAKCVDCHLPHDFVPKYIA